MTNELMGPPRPGPIVVVSTKGLYLKIRVDDDLDLAILQAVIKRAEAKRYGR